jgi:lipid-A-disaccharide synthase
MESSSNIHLKELLKYLPKDIELLGIFDKSLGTPTYDVTSLAVMGFTDALKKLPFFLKLNRQMAALAKDADKVLLMDASGFNLPLAKKIKKLYPNKEIIYYILPQAWAWKKARVQKLEAYCDTLCSILPFEQELYTQKDKIHYVGHPLLDEITTFKQTLSNSGKIVFMPGSRKTEITNLMPIYRQIVQKLHNKEAVLVIPAHFTHEYIEKTYGDISQFSISNNTHESLIQAEFAFICSGTATLEAALIGTPFCLNYIAKKLDYFIGRKFVKLPYIGLANIFFDKIGKPPLHQEFLQEAVTVENLMHEYEHINKEQFLDNAKVLRGYLQHGSSKTVAKLIEK